MQEDLDPFKNENRHKRGFELSLENLVHDVDILSYCFNENVNMSIREFDLSALHFVSPSG